MPSAPDAIVFLCSAVLLLSLALTLTPMVRDLVWDVRGALVGVDLTPATDDVYTLPTDTH